MATVYSVGSLLQPIYNAAGTKITGIQNPDGTTASLSGGGGGTGLTPAQEAAGADSVVGTNSANELINKTGGKDFVANIIPRLQTETTIASLVNGGGEIASTSDTGKLALLYGTPGSGTVQWFHADDRYSRFFVSGYGYTDFVGDLDLVTPGRRSWTITMAPTSAFFTDGTTWNALTNTQRIDYVSGVNNGTQPGFTVDGLSGNVNATVYAEYQITLLNKFYSRIGGVITPGADNDNTIPAFKVVDSSINVFISAQGGVPDQNINGTLDLGTGTGGGKMDVKIVASDGNLGFYGTTPIPRRTAANVGAGGSRVGTTGNTVTDAATFDGGLGGNAYTIGQIVRALKQYGLLA